MTVVAEYVMGVDEARRLTERIRLTALSVRDGMEKVQGLVEQARDGNAHLALGYASWTAYLSDTLGSEPLRLPRDQRQELVGYLAGEGMSTRAIAPIVGVSDVQVHRDIHAQVLPHVAPAPATPVDLAAVDMTTGEIHEPVTGLDGKTYSRPEPRPRIAQRDDAETYLNLAQSFADRAAREVQKLTPAQIERVKPNAAHWVSGIGESVEALQHLLTSLTKEKK